MMRLAGAAALVLTLTAPAADVRPIVREAYLMGTRTTLTTWDDDRARGLQRLDRMLAAMEAVEQQLSTWRDDSDVSRLNARAEAGPVALSASLCAQLRALDAIAADTMGAFDPAVGALTAAWDLHGRGRVPTPAERASALAHSGWRKVVFDGRACTLALPPGVSLDVGGFGKGEAIDRARDAAGDDAPWLVDLGGQVGAHGPRAWEVGVAHPLDRSTAVLRLTLSSGSLSTSAGSERDLTVDGRRVGHILDPRTGRPAAYTGSVTVWHESGLVADALSTALFVMGPEKGLRWADERGIAVVYLTPDTPDLKVGPTFRLKVGPTFRATVARRPSRAFAAKFSGS